MTRQDTERLSSDTLSLYNLLIKGVNMEGAVANEWDQYIGQYIGTNTSGQ